MRPPTKPMRPPMMGGMKKPSIGAPSPVGMKQPPQRPAFMADGGMGGDSEPDADDMGGGATPSPEALHYHPDPQSCQLCEYMGPQGQCAILKIQVNPEGACANFEAKEGGSGEEMGGSPDEEDMGGPPPAPGGGRSMYGG